MQTGTTSASSGSSSTSMSLTGPCLRDGLLGHQLADIGVAAAAGAENRAADGDVFEVFGMDRAQDLHGSHPRRSERGVGSGLKESSG